jgi:hypothetical protein
VCSWTTWCTNRDQSVCHSAFNMGLAQSVA